MRSSIPLFLAVSAPLTMAGCAPARALLNALASLQGSATPGTSPTAPIDTGAPLLTDTGSPLLTDTAAPDDPTPGDEPDPDEVFPVIVTGITLPAPGETTLAQATYDLSWEGEEMAAMLDVTVAQERSTLYTGGAFVEQRIGEERSVSFSLEVPAAGVAAGASLEGILYYGESPVEPDWLDVLLGTPVTVDVVTDPDDPGALSFRVAEAPLEPTLGVGAMRAGQLYEGPYDLFIDPVPQLDCGALPSDQLSFVSQTLEELAASQNEAFALDPSYASLSRGSQGADPMEPFQFSGRLVDTLTSVNGTYSLQRVPDSGGLVELDFFPFGSVVDGTFGSFSVMDLREGPGIYEIGRRLTIDGRVWGPGFALVVERFYAETPDATWDEAVCIATFDGTLQTFSY